MSKLILDRHSSPTNQRLRRGILPEIAKQVKDAFFLNHSFVAFAREDLIISAKEVGVGQ